MNAKPIKPSYSILLMRDDCTVSTFRMRTFWFKLIIALVLLLVAVCALTVYGTLHYQERYRIATQERHTLQAELSELRVQLQERANLAILPPGQADRHRAALGGRSQPYSVNSIAPAARAGAGQREPGTGAASPSTGAASPSTGAAAPSTGAAAPGVTPADASGAAPGNTGAAASSASPATAATSAASGTASQAASAPSSSSSVSGTSSPAAPSTPSAEDMRRLLDANPAAVAGVRSDPGEATETENHPIKIANMAVVFEAGNKMRVSFDISNQPQKETLAGNCSVSVITRQGAEVKLASTAPGSLTFRIERYKKMQSVLILPENIAKNDIVRIKFAVTVNDLPNYWRIFPYPLPR